MSTHTAITAAAVALMLASCDMPKSAEPSAADKLKAGQVALVAEAPDGTKLWAVQDQGRRIYFAAAGTQWTYRSGKTTHTIDVPSGSP